jgi:hypothetical protein
MRSFGLTTHRASCDAPLRSTWQLDPNPVLGVSDLEGPTVLRVRGPVFHTAPGATQRIAARSFRSHSAEEGWGVLWAGITEEAAEDAVSPSDAIEWFVSSGSHEEPGPWYLRRWAVWIARSGSRADDVSVFELERELRMLPPPWRAGREVLGQYLMSVAPPRQCGR